MLTKKNEMEEHTMKRRSTVAAVSQGMRALLLLLALLLAFAGCNTTNPPMETSPSEDSSTGEDSSTAEETTTSESEKNPISIPVSDLGAMVAFFREYKVNNHGKMFVIDANQIDYYYIHPEFRASECVDGMYKNPQFRASFLLSAYENGADTDFNVISPTLISYDLSNYPDLSESVLSDAVWQPWESLPETLTGVQLTYSGIVIYGIYFQEDLPEARQEWFLQTVLDLMVLLEY